MTISWPGFVNDVAPSGPVAVDWGNAVRDRATQVFDTTANRDTAIPTPQVGQTCVITTGAGAGLYVYAGASAKWCPPWAQAWGEVAFASTGASQNGITTTVDLTSLSVTWTPIVNRKYRTTLYLPRLLQNTSAGTVKPIIANAASTGVSEADMSLVAAGVGSIEVVERVTAAAVTAITRKGRISTSAGTVDVATAVIGSGVAYIMVEDIGPGGAPT